MCFSFLPWFVSSVDKLLRMPLKRFVTVTSGENWKRERELLHEKKIGIVQLEVPALSNICLIKLTFFYVVIGVFISVY
jgi:hypothetical protein